MKEIEVLEEWIKHLEFLNEELGECVYRLAEIKVMEANKKELENGLKNS